MVKMNVNSLNLKPLPSSTGAGGGGGVGGAGGRSGEFLLGGNVMCGMA